MARIASKEVGWSFSDQEEAAIIDMRLGMEKSFIFGSRGMYFDPLKNENVYFTGGIWGQAPRSAELPLDTLAESDLIELCAKAFTGNNGSKRKILIAGTSLMEALSKLQYSKVLSAGETRVKWGIEFKEIVSNFGTLYVLHSEVFRCLRPCRRRLHHRPQLPYEVCACALPGRKARPQGFGSAQYRRRRAHRGFVSGTPLSAGAHTCNR